MTYGGHSRAIEAKYTHKTSYPLFSYPLPYLEGMVAYEGCHVTLKLVGPLRIILDVIDEMLERLPTIKNIGGVIQTYGRKR